MMNARFARASLAVLTAAGLGLTGFTATGPAAADLTIKLPSILTDNGSSTGSGTGSWDPQIKRSKGIGYTVEGDGKDITYTATDVPRVGRPPVTLPGSCQSVAVDVVKAVPVVGPSIFALIRGDDVDVADLISRLRAAPGVVAGLHTVRTANSAGTVKATFSNLPPAVYLVASVCNLVVDRNHWGAATARVRGDGNGSLGSSAS